MLTPGEETSAQICVRLWMTVSFWIPSSLVFLHIPFHSCTLSGIQISFAILSLNITASPPLPRSLSSLSFSSLLSLLFCIITQVIVESLTASPPPRKLWHHLINSWNKHHMLLEFRGWTYWGREGGQVFEKEDRRRTETRWVADFKFLPLRADTNFPHRDTDSLGKSWTCYARWTYYCLWKDYWGRG